MKIKKHWRICITGIAAGAVNGLFGAGGGMVLVPMLTKFAELDEDEVFPSSVSIILPICLISLSFSLIREQIDWLQALPYLIGSTAGGVAAGFWGKKIPVQWLHRILGLLILWGGIRYLC